MRYLKEMITVLALLCIVTYSQAQRNYNTAIGLRLGPTYGFTIKHFISDRVALEGLVTSRYYGAGIYGRGGWNGSPGLMLTGLAEWHFPIGNIQGFNWFVGGGFHLGVMGGYRAHPHFGNDRAYFLTGLDAIGGVEYTLPNAPVTFQADIKPSFHLVEYFGVWYNEAALTVRYTFR
jgi:hypothetical protein